MSPQLKKILLYLLPLGFIPYLLICFYNNPNADDFTFGYLGKNTDVITEWIGLYHSIGGRYTSNFLVLIGPLTFDSFLLYKFIPPLLLVIHWFSIKVFLKALIGKSVSRTELNLLCYLLVFLFIYQMPIISEGLYWYSGTMTYTMGCFAVLWLFTLMIQFIQSRYIFGNQFFHLVLITAVNIIAVGFNEVLMFIIILLLSIATFIRFRNKLPAGRIIGYLLLITFASSFLVFLAPGNAVRQAHYPLSHHFFYSLKMSLAQTARFFITWVSSAPLWILSFGYYFLHKKWVHQFSIFRVSFYLNLVVSTGLLLVVIFICVFPAYWSTGILGQHRTLNVAYFIFIFLWFINLTVWFNWVEGKLKSISVPKKPVIIALFTLLLGCFLFVKNGFYVSSDIISGRARNFDQQMNLRYSQMRAAKPGDTIFFKPMEHPPKSLPFYEIKSDPRDWLNHCWIKYFHPEGGVLVAKE